MTNLFEPFRLTIARQYNSLRKVDLARELDLSPSAITQMENGAAKPSHATLAKIALRLGFPMEFFLHDGRRRNDYALGQSFFRSLRSTPQLVRERAEAHAFLVCELVESLEMFVRLPAVDIPSISALDARGPIDIEDAAAELRERWCVPRGPIANVVRLLESRGVVVTRASTASRHLDAFSRWFGARPTVVLCAGRSSLDRLRFDAAHELGHIVMHADVEPGNKELEAEAHAFAAAFLMPATDIFDQLPTRFDLRTFGELKQIWGVSIAALVYRARSLGRFSESVYKRAMVVLSKMGRVVEPFFLPGEEELFVLPQAAAILIRDNKRLEDVAQTARLPIDFVKRTMATQFDDRPLVELDSQARAHSDPLSLAAQAL
jgi:Zn-dependent peptidase ImmA (M78 family)/transcriptional regulator with XRE-family HTH domain